MNEREQLEAFVCKRWNASAEPERDADGVYISGPVDFAWAAWQARAALAAAPTALTESAASVSAPAQQATAVEAVHRHQKLVNLATELELLAVVQDAKYPNLGQVALEGGAVLREIAAEALAAAATVPSVEAQANKFGCTVTFAPRNVPIYQIWIAGERFTLFRSEAVQLHAALDQFLKEPQQ